MLYFADMWESLYRSTKMPVVPMYGLFPVKLRTHIGAPIYPEPGVTPEQLSARVVAAVEQMICQHQVLPATLSQVSAGDNTLHCLTIYIISRHSMSWIFDVF